MMLLSGRSWRSISRPALVIGVGGAGGEIAQEKVFQTGQQLGLVERRQLDVIYLDTDDHDRMAQQSQGDE